MAFIVFVFLVLSALAAFAHLAVLFTVLWFLGGLYIVTRIYTHRARQSISAGRSHRLRATVGDALQVDLTVRNASRLPLPWAELHESVPLDLKEGPEPHAAFALGPRGSQSFSYKLRCRKRGVYRLGPAIARMGDVFGLEERTVHLPAGDAVVVYPRTVSLRSLGLKTLSSEVSHAAALALFHDISRVVGAREYREGDSPRHMHWSASARSNRLLVKQFQPAVARGVVVALEMDARAYPTLRHEAGEQAIMVAASLLRHAHEGETTPCGLVSEGFDALTESRLTWRYEPRTGAAHYSQIREVLARVQLSDDAPLSPLLLGPSSILPSGCSLYVVTGSLRVDLAESLLRLQRLGMNVSAIVVRPPGAAEIAPVSFPVYRVWVDNDLVSAA